MSLQQWLLLGHILAAVAWMGAGLTLFLLSVRAGQTGEELKLVSQMEWIGSRIGGPSVIIVLGTGVWMVSRSTAWQFTQFWVLGALAILTVLFLIGVGFHMPQYKRIRRAVEEHGHGSPAVSRLIVRSFAATRIEVILLAIAVYLMVFKPGI